MTDYHATPTTLEPVMLAEGPVWDAARNRVLWIDVLGGTVFEGALVPGPDVEITARHQFDGMVGAVVFADDGTLLVAGQEQLVIQSPDGERTPGPRIVPEGIASRTNDGAVDPAGRLLVGTTALDDRVGHERLVRVEDTGALTVIDDDLELSNGIAWSPDGSLLYSVDSDRYIIWVRDYDAASGAVGDRRVHLTLEGGYPDGICIDALGRLWVAVWGAGEVRCFSEGGELVHTVYVDAPHTSSVAFVGADCDVLLITTAREGLSGQQLAAHPDSGRLFTVRVDANGLPTPAWSGSRAHQG